MLIQDITHEVIELFKDTTKNILLVTDIDDTILSSYIGQKLTHPSVIDMINVAFNVNRLIFLTARDPSLFKTTQNHLNKAKLCKKGRFIYYNILMSPYDEQGSTKGPSLAKYLNKYNNWIHPHKENIVIFIDNEFEHITSVIDNCTHDSYTLKTYHCIY